MHLKILGDLKHFRGKQLCHFHFASYHSWDQLLKKRKFFPLKKDPILECLPHQEIKEGDIKVVSLCKNGPKYEINPFTLIKKPI